MELVDYDVRKEFWYSPQQVINDTNNLVKEYGYEEILQHKSVREMYTAAIALVGAYKLNPDNKYWLQLNNQSESPDVMAAMLSYGNDGKVLIFLNKLEVTEFEEHHPNSDIVDFLLSTKLSPKKSYDKRTMILVMVNRKLSINYEDVSKKLRDISPESTIYIVGRVHGKKESKFYICSPYPILVKPIEFDVFDTASLYNIKPRITFHRGMTNKIVFAETQTKPHNRLRMLGIDKKLMDHNL